MTATSSLITERSAEYAYVLLIDGCPIGFATHAVLSEIADFTGEGHTLQPFLMREGTLEAGIDIRTGRFDSFPATFELVDFAGTTLAELFASLDDTETQLEQHIGAGEDLTARTDLHGMHVGIEAIGPAGERHRYSFLPGYNVGYFHPGSWMELPDIEPAPVSESPIVWLGRRCALYQVFRDHVTYPQPVVDAAGGVLGVDALGLFVLGGAGGSGASNAATWRPFSEAQRVWVGTLRDAGETDGIRWSLECDGPESFLQGEFGRLTQRESVEAIPTIQLTSTEGEDETRIGILLTNRGVGGAVNETFASDNFTTSITGTTPSEIRAEIAAAIAAAAADTGPAGVFGENRGQYVEMDPSTGDISIRIEDAGGGTEYAAHMVLSLHRRVWTAIGYDPSYQSQLGGDDPLYLQFQDPAPGLDVPGDGYVEGRISTSPPNADNDLDNDGSPWIYHPRFSGGTASLLADLNGGRGQVIDLDNEFAGTTIYHRGQTNRPVFGDPDLPADPYTMPAGAFADGGEVNRQGYWLFFGKRAFASIGGEDVVVDEYWVGRASWISGSLAQSGQVKESRIVVHEWLAARQFGIDRPSPTGEWVVRTTGEHKIKAVPILYFGYGVTNNLDRIDYVIDRILHSTGTSGGFFSDPPTYSLPGYEGVIQVTQEPGDNESPSAFFVRRDAEVEDMGLGVPAELVQSSIDMAIEVDSLPGGLGWVKLGTSPGFAADDLLEGLMRPFGLGWHMRGGRFGVFSLHRPIELDQVEHVLTQADKVAPGNRSKQEQRAFAPIDTFQLSYNWAPMLQRMLRQIEHASPDKGRYYRPGALVEEIPAHGVTQAHDGFRELFGEIGRWWERRHFFLDDWQVMGREPIFVGERVRINEPRAVAPDGTVGITAMRGVIVQTRIDLESGLWSARIFVHDDTNGLPRFHGPVARGIGYDTDNDRLYVADNWLGFLTNGTWSDASFFIEPSYEGLTAIGGDADIYAIQWDGETWSLNVTATVDSIDTTPGSSYLQLSSVSGTYFHKMDTIVLMAPRGVQGAAWVEALYAVICDKAGEFNSTTGPKWEQ